MTLGIGAMALYGAVTSGWNSVPSEHVMSEMRSGESMRGRSNDMGRDSMSPSSSSPLSSSSSPALSAAYTAGGGGADYQQLQQAEMGGGARMGGMGDKVIGKAKKKADVYLPDRKPTDSKLERFIGRGG